MHSSQPMHGTQVPDSSTDPAGQAVLHVSLYRIKPSSQLVHVVTNDKQVLQTDEQSRHSPFELAVVVFPASQIS